MIHIKYFESNWKTLPHIGDYIKMRTDSKNIGLVIFYNENIGRVIDVDPYYVTVMFKNQPPKSSKHIFDYDYEKDQYEKMFNINKIVDFAKSEEDLIRQIEYNTKKFNI